MPDKTEKRKASGDNHLSFWNYHLAEPCFVYVMQGAEGTPIKVGRAHNPRRRLAELQTGNPTILRLLYVIPGGSDTEAHLHRRLKGDRVHGEWFHGKLVDPFLAYIHDLAQAMVDSYRHDGKAPHIFDVDPVRFGKVRKAPKDNPVTVRFVEPNPVVDPVEARGMRDSVRGCSRAVIAGPVDSVVRQQISRTPEFYR